MKKVSIPSPTQEPNLNKNTLSFNELFDFIKKQEGVNLVAVPDGKKDGKQLYSIGLGHQILPGEDYLLTATLNESEILDLFKKDSEKIRISMNRVIKVPLNKNQQLALFSLRYNIGEGAFNSSTLLRKLNSSDYAGAADEFSKWRIFEGKVNRGLVSRREREKVLFTKPV